LSDRTGGFTEHGFHADRPLFRGHLIAPKSLGGAGITERPPWALIEETLTWACRADAEVAIGDVEYLDEFFNVASHLWGGLHSLRRRFFEEQNLMLSLAAQCGIRHNLDAKLPHKNVIEYEDMSQRPLLEYALILDKECEWFASGK
jgi:hypothetical protein